MDKAMQNMIWGFSYKTWVETCDMFLSPTNMASYKMYLQQYPFTKMSPASVKEIKSISFFNKYIATGRIIFDPNLLFRSKNYITKNSGSFRNSNLISPILFLLLQAVSLEIFTRYNSVSRNDKHVMAFYSGNFKLRNALYKNEYNNFSNLNNQYANNGFSYFIKTDLSDYFSNINLNILNYLIDKHSNKKFTPLQQKSIIDLLSYCGNGKFPIVQNSTGSSFLATIIYLDEIDYNLNKYIGAIENIENYKLIRYVDDLYIWIKPKNNILDINKTYNQIRSKYSSLLHNYGLTMNTEKTNLFKSKNINKELKKSNYEEHVKHLHTSLIEHDKLKSNLKDFITNLIQYNTENKLNKNTFETIVEQSFKPKHIVEYTGEEVLKYIVYDNLNLLNDTLIANSIADLINADITILYFSPQIMTNMVLNSSKGKTKNQAIKSFLNCLFIKANHKNINAYDIDIIIYYLLHTNFHHYDLLFKIIKPQDKKLFDYIANFCKKDFYTELNVIDSDKHVTIIKKDWKTYYLYLNYCLEKSKKSYMTMFSYYKTYFDRFTMCLASYIKKSSESPQNYYSVEQLNEVYKHTNKNSYKIIKKANNLRDKNPLVHSSSELIGQPDSTHNINKNINNLNMLINEALKKVFVNV